MFEAPALLRVLWADPQHMAEHLALWSVKHFGPRASSAVQKLQRENPDGETSALERMAIERQTRVAMTEGAVVGGPFIVFIPVAFCAALLAQAQMALELAALAGYAPDDQMRAADLLVLQGAYPSTDEARPALTSVARVDSRPAGRRLPRGSRWSMVKRMAYLLGVLGSSEEKPSRLSSVLRWCLLGLTFAVGLVLPLVWVPYMAVAVRRTSIQLGERGTQFYRHNQTVESGVTVKKAQLVHVGITAGLVRTVALTLIPIAVAVIAILTGVDVGGGRLLSAGILLLAASALATIGWLTYRWWRRRR